jgi:hypothetical protein
MFAEFVRFKTAVELEIRNKLKMLRSDNGGEFTYKKIWGIFDKRRDQTSANSALHFITKWSQWEEKPNIDGNGKMFAIWEGNGIKILGRCSKHDILPSKSYGHKSFRRQDFLWNLL